MANGLAQLFGGTNSYADSNSSWMDPSFLDTGIYSSVLMDQPNFINTDYYKELFPEIGSQSGLAGLFSNIGGAQGLAGILGGLGSIGSAYFGYQQNKLAKDAQKARMAEYNRQKQRDADFAKNINASGLGTYSSGIN